MAKLCGECGIKLSMWDVQEIDGIKYCKECIVKVDVEIEKRNEIIKKGVNHIFATTAENPTYLNIIQHLDIVSSRVLLKMDIFEDFFINFMDDFGGRSRGLQRRFKKAEKEALQELKIEVATIGGDGVAGLKVDYNLIEGKKGKMILVNMIGTAVKVADLKN